MFQRRSGILLHITSLPSRFGVGDLGPWAYRFADLLAEAGQSIWQVLPVTPVRPGTEYSPYSSPSAFAGNPLLVSPELLVRDGLLSRRDLTDAPPTTDQRADYDRVWPWKRKLLAKAYHHWVGRRDERFEIFCDAEKDWLEDHALFLALRESRKEPSWVDWPAALRDRRPATVAAARAELAKPVAVEKFSQYLFYRQWQALKDYCGARNIQLFGDIPIYVMHDSAELWANPKVFQLDAARRMRAVGGYPPSRFATGGQLWGMPLYNWRHHDGHAFEWWVRRIAHNLRVFNWVRLDHFLGLVRYWRIPADTDDPARGTWHRGPGPALFHLLARRFSLLPFVVEDLGLPTAESREIMQQFHLPGMRVLVDAFAGHTGLSRFAPQNYIQDCVAYTGTHDNNTIAGWWAGATPQERRRFREYVGYSPRRREVHWEFIRLVMMSVANAAIVSLQDVLGLGPEARMNTPGTTEGNWRWRATERMLTAGALARLAKLTEIYGRA